MQLYYINLHYIISFLHWKPTTYAFIPYMKCPFLILFCNLFSRRYCLSGFLCYLCIVSSGEQNRSPTKTDNVAQVACHFPDLVRMSHLWPLSKKCTLAVRLAFVGYSLTLCAVWYQNLQAWIFVVFFDILDCAAAYLEKVWIAMPWNSK